MANTLSVMNVLRNAVSKKRIRYKENGFNLDLTYICDNVIAMGYPAPDKLEGCYRNRLSDVYKFLEENHRNHYKIYNLCLERSYDVNNFHGRVAIYPFEDHNPPTIELILRFCGDVDAWLKENSLNVVAVHCKAGKGRTGTMICCYLLYSRFEVTADGALSWYDEKRTKDRKGVTIPSQRRYVQYFSMLVRSGKSYKTTILRLCEIRFAESCILTNAGNVICTVSVLQNSTTTTEKVTVKQLKNWIIDFHKTSVLDIKNSTLPVAGDIKVELSQRSARKVLFHFWINTYFVPEIAVREGEGSDAKLVYTLSKFEIDDAHKDKEHKMYAEDFKVQLVFCAESQADNNTAVEYCSSPTFLNSSSDYNISYTTEQSGCASNSRIDMVNGLAVDINNDCRTSHNTAEQITQQSLLDPPQVWGQHSMFNPQGWAQHNTQLDPQAWVQSHLNPKVWGNIPTTNNLYLPPSAAKHKQQKQFYAVEYTDGDNCLSAAAAATVADGAAVGDNFRTKHKQNDAVGAANIIKPSITTRRCVSAHDQSVLSNIPKLNLFGLGSSSSATGSEYNVRCDLKLHSTANNCASVEYVNAATSSTSTLASSYKPMNDESSINLNHGGNISKSQINGLSTSNSYENGIYCPNRISFYENDFKDNTKHGVVMGSGMVIGQRPHDHFKVSASTSVGGVKQRDGGHIMASDAIKLKTLDNAARMKENAIGRTIDDDTLLLDRTNADAVNTTINHNNNGSLSSTKGSNSKQKLKTTFKKNKQKLTKKFPWLQNYFQSDPEQFCQHIVQPTEIRRNSNCSEIMRNRKLNAATAAPAATTTTGVTTAVAAATLKTTVPMKCPMAMAKMLNNQTSISWSCPNSFNNNVNIIGSLQVKSKSFISLCNPIFNIGDDYYSKICDNQLSSNNSPCKSPRSFVENSNVKHLLYQQNRYAVHNINTGLISHGNENIVIVAAKPAKIDSIGFTVPSGGGVVVSSGGSGSAVSMYGGALTEQQQQQATTKQSSHCNHQLHKYQTIRHNCLNNTTNTTTTTTTSSNSSSCTDSPYKFDELSNELQILNKKLNTDCNKCNDCSNLQYHQHQQHYQQQQQHQKQRMIDLDKRKRTNDDNYYCLCTNLNTARHSSSSTGDVDGSGSSVSVGDSGGKDKSYLNANKKQQIALLLSSSTSAAAAAATSMSTLASTTAKNFKQTSEKCSNSPEESNLRKLSYTDNE